ncbi:probable hexosyltransferase MUCI70 isoform X2 [Malania oleifera]|uniref:probable hexosyltransferase MUCI70 isoform X2 n=1 Tax=Malania oleifera TaxID=397392 RepID=UPI0025ADB8CE|nr:probable hexosyltransferase MUCI70 isoform X2 [Malania oleifera]
MTGGALGLRTGSYGSLQLQTYNGALRAQSTAILVRKPSKLLLSSSREKERLLPLICRYLGRRRIGMLVLVVFALLMFVASFFTVDKGSSGSTIAQRLQNIRPYEYNGSSFPVTLHFPVKEDNQKGNPSVLVTATEFGGNKAQPHPPVISHQCANFAFPPPPPSGGKRIGPRPCPVCYLPVKEAIASMPSSPQISPVLRNLNYFHEENPIKTESHGGSDFGGYPSLKQRNESFDVKESMMVHCGFVKGNRPGHQTGFDIAEEDLTELEQFHDVVVASAIFGNYDIIQQPKNISEAARENVPFYMFIDEETEAYMKNSSAWDGSKMIGLWRIVVVHNIPYNDARRNGKVPKLLLHRIFPNIRYSIWIDGKLQLVVDPYQILERFLWRQNASFAISRHYRRFDVFVEAEANKAAGKYDNSSIDYQIDFYRKEGLTRYSEAKLPITSDVPEGCVIIREHIPITNLFTCLWFNEVDRFTARDQLSFSTVRDKIMSKVNWNVSMFMDCERRSFVIQAYHRELLEHMRPAARASVSPRSIEKPSSVVGTGNVTGRVPGRKNPSKRGRGDRRSGSRHHRKVVVGKRDNIFSN